MPVLLEDTTAPTKSPGVRTPTGEHYIPLPKSKEDGRVTSHAVQTILAGAQSLFQLWSNVSAFPRWQEHVVSVTPTGANTSHWVMGNPEDADGKRLEFDSEVYEQTPGSRIAWRSIGGDVEQSGEVRFEPLTKGEFEGTRVTLIQTVKVPGGLLGNAAAAVAKRSPEQTVIENLRHFKELAEAHEIPSIKDQPHGPRGAIGGVKEWALGETNPTPPGTGNKA